MAAFHLDIHDTTSSRTCRDFSRFFAARRIQHQVVTVQELFKVLGPAPPAQVRPSPAVVPCTGDAERDWQCPKALMPRYSFEEFQAAVPFRQHGCREATPNRQKRQLQAKQGNFLM